MALSDQLQKLQEIDFNDLDFENVGIWPAPVKILSGIVLLGLLLFAGYWFHLKELGATLETHAKKETELRDSYQKKAFKAANLNAYRLQMKEMETSFGAMLEQLPKDTEVPGLLEDITQTGLGTGLEFNSIKLLPEKAREFYVELPIQVTAEGAYHDLGSFVSGVANLPRIVTLHDFKIGPQPKTGNLNLSITAKTYRYREQEGAK